jgi:hypothetical protein
VPYIDYAGKRYMLTEAQIAAVRTQVHEAMQGGTVELQVSDNADGTVEYLIWSPGVPLVFGGLGRDLRSVDDV